MTKKDFDIDLQPYVMVSISPNLRPVAFLSALNIMVVNLKRPNKKVKK